MAEEATKNSGYGWTHILGAVLGGAAVGAAIALLAAPGSGVETRHRLRELASSGRDRVGRLPHAVRDAAEAARNVLSTAMTEERPH